MSKSRLELFLPPPIETEHAVKIIGTTRVNDIHTEKNQPSSSLSNLMMSISDLRRSVRQFSVEERVRENLRATQMQLR